MARTRLRLRRLALAAAALVAAQGGVSLLLLLPRVHDALRARLERALGRPVEVGRFGVSVWTGLRLEAHYVTVGEDPQFGYEFVLRADRLSAAPRWRALLLGRLEFSRYSFERPSLNLVRTSDGHWNFEAWTAASRNREAIPGGRDAGRVDGISISNGRINFKRGGEKLAFALTGVNGQLSLAADGRWNLSLEARPLRAGVTLQDAGTLRFAGTLPVDDRSAAAPAASALPAEFSLEWSKVSLSDALRLISASDYGVRGSLEGSLTGRFSRTGAIAAASAWKISGALRLADVHRWDLPLQPGAPAINLSVVAEGSADRREWEWREIVLEARRSKLRGTAEFRLGENARASLRVVSASIHLDDLLAWYRAFHPGVRPGTSLDGYLGADVELRGWPVSIVHATLATTGARLNVAGESRPIEIQRTVLEASAKGARLVATRLAAGEDDLGVHLSGSADWTQAVPFEVSLTGGTSHLAEYSTALAALGLSPGENPLRFEGKATARLDWKGTARPWRVATAGMLALEDVALSGGLLRSGITVGKARLDFLPGQRRLEIGATKAFGAVWNGILGAPTLAGPWKFSLAADRLIPAMLVRGFSNLPPENSGLLSRILPAQAAATLAREAPRWPEWLRGEGTLAAGALAIGRLEFERVKGHLTIGEREISLEGAEAALYGGRVRGEVRAGFGEQPLYNVRADFEGVSVAPLAALAASTRECCTGSGAGHVELSTSGWNRDALLASLAGAGRAEVRSGALLTLDLPATLAGEESRPGRSVIRDASAEFLVSSGRVQFERLRVDLPGGRVEGKGSASLRGELDVELASQEGRTGAAAAPRGAAAVTSGVRVTGTLAAPLVSPQPIAP
jgi:uncharacterized protein involved in outer membrane biogenesis